MRSKIVLRCFFSRFFSFLLIFITFIGFIGFRSVPRIMRLEWQIWSSPQVWLMDRRSLNLIQYRSHAYWNRGGWSRNARNEQSSKWIRIKKWRIKMSLSLSLSYRYLCISSQSQGCRKHMATLEQSAARPLLKTSSNIAWIEFRDSCEIITGTLKLTFFSSMLCFTQVSYAGQAFCCPFHLGLLAQALVRETR